MHRQIKTQYWRKTNHCDGDLTKLSLSAEPHHPGPNEVELFLDGERPGDTEWPRSSGGNRNQEILKKHWIGPPRRRPCFEYGVGLRRTQDRDNHKHEKENRIVQRPDSKTAPGIEILEIPLRLLRVEQNPRYQESRQHKEKIYSHPSVHRD